MLKRWSFGRNPFYSKKKVNFKRAVKISTYTDAQLFARKADTFFGPLYLSYHVFHLALLAAYNTWKAQGGTQKGSTALVEIKLAELSPGKIGDWDLLIQGVFKKKTPSYIAIFPNGHKPFQTGDKMLRINAIEQLKINLAGIVALETVLTDVTSFYDAILLANTIQEGNKGTKFSYSAAVLLVIATAMDELYAILGDCMRHYKKNPVEVENIFDMVTIRNQLQSIFTGIVPINGHTMIVERALLPTDSFDAIVDGATSLGFYRAINKTDSSNGYTIVNVNSGENKTITGSDFKLDIANKFLCVENTSTIAASHYELNFG